MRPDRLQELIRRFSNCRVAVLGDFFLDKYLDVDPALAEISLETGKTAHQVVSVRCSPGAAGTVVNNLAALGAGELHAVGFTGDDGEGFELRRALEKAGCNTDGLARRVGWFTPTYLKPRDRGTADLAGEHERYDTKNRIPVPGGLHDHVLAYLNRVLPALDAVITVDQVPEDGCGIVAPKVRDGLAELAGRWADKVFWADSRSRIGWFRNVMIKVNLGEALRQVFPGKAQRDGTVPIGGAGSGGESFVDDTVVREAMSELRRRTGKPVFVTAGARGMWAGDPVPELVRAVRVPGPVDPTGAGDSATAGAVLALCAGAELHEAALLANLVASITIEQLATTGTASPDQLAPRLALWRSQG